MKKLTLLTTTLMLTFSLTAQALIGDEFNSNLKKAKLGDRQCSVYCCRSLCTG